jgi:signal transduction histidine kinase
VNDLLAPLPAHGIATELDVPDDLVLSEDVDLVFYRAAGEAIRNVERHAGASRVSVRVGKRDGRARLEIVDDGAGFTAEERERRRAEGHVGLSILDELAERMHGTLDIRSSPGAGTTFVLEVPDP